MPKTVGDVLDNEEAKALMEDTRRERLEAHMPVANKTRLDKLALLTRGLELPKDATQHAKNSYYSAREQFVKQAIALNYTDMEICTALDISGHMLSKIKTRVYSNEIQTVQRMTQMEHFVEYRLKQMEVIKDLDVLVEKFRVGSNLMGLASALKAKADALKELKSTAQEVGLMDKQAEEIRIVGGVNVRECSNDELFDMIDQGNALMEKLLKPAKVIDITPKKK